MSRKSNLRPQCLAYDGLVQITAEEYKTYWYTTNVYKSLSCIDNLQTKCYSAGISRWYPFEH